MWFTAIAALCLILAPIGIGLDAYLFTVATHQKGGLSDINLMLMTTVGVFSFFSLLMGAREYSSVRKLKMKLKQVDLFEETIYNEVLKTRIP
jgi:hypothetical protein